MRDRVREFFEREMRLEEARDQRPVHIAACALLLELAHADDEFSDAERLHIEAVLRRHFQLDEATALDLMELAESERRSAEGIERFADLIRERYDQGQKTLLAEIMWGLILSDGEIGRHEAFVLREISRMLDLEAGYLADVRKNLDHDDD